MSLRIAPWGSSGIVVAQSAWSSLPPTLDAFLKTPTWTLAAPSTSPGVIGYFMAPSRADAPPPAGGNDGASGAGSGGSDGGGGGKKGKNPFVEQLLTPQTMLRSHELVAQVSLALAQGLMTMDELRAHLKEKIDSEALARVRKRFAPDIVTTSEVVERAIEEISTTGPSDETCALLKERNAGRVEATQEGAVQNFGFRMYSNDVVSEVTSLPTWLQDWGEGAGPIMHELAKRFLTACAPQLPRLHDELWHSGQDYCDPFIERNSRRSDEYNRRVEMRPHLVSLMMMTDREGTKTFFQTILGNARKILSQVATAKDAKREPQQQQAAYGELRCAALQGLMQLGGPTVLECLDPLLAYLNGLKQKPFSHGDAMIRATFEAFGRSLEQAVILGSVSRDEADCAVERIKDREGALKKCFTSFGRLGGLAAPYLVGALETLLALPDPLAQKSGLLMERLAELRISLGDDEAHYPLLRFGKKELKRLLKAVLLSGEALHDVAQADDDVRAIMTMVMKQYPDELPQVLAENNALNAAFNAWRDQHLRRHTRVR